MVVFLKKKKKIAMLELELSTKDSVRVMDKRRAGAEIILRTSLCGGTTACRLVPSGAGASSSLRSPSAAAPAAVCGSTGGGGASSPSLVFGFAPQFPIASSAPLLPAIDALMSPRQGTRDGRSSEK